MTTRTKLTDYGTAGLLQWIARGETGLAATQLPGLRAAKIASAARVVRARYGADAESIFRAVARREAVARDAVRYLASGQAKPDSPLIHQMAAYSRVAVPVLAARASQS